MAILGTLRVMHRKIHYLYLLIAVCLILIIVDTQRSVPDTDSIDDVGYNAYRLRPGYIRRILPQLPIQYWVRNVNQTLQYNATCARMPTLQTIEFNNIYWQYLHIDTVNQTILLYRAYYDLRDADKPLVRILAVTDGFVRQRLLYAQFWYENSTQPKFSEITEWKFIWNRAWTFSSVPRYRPYLLTFPVPVEAVSERPEAVSIVVNPCQNATNHLNVLYIRPDHRRKFAVCVKGLDFPYEDISARLIEWVELLGLMGVSRIFFYKLQVHRNVRQVLNYYENTGQVKVIPITLPGVLPNAPPLQHIYLALNQHSKRLNELIPYNDCLYRNLYSYEFLALLDLDEIILPVRTKRWEKLMEVLDAGDAMISEGRRDYYVFPNFYYFNDKEKTEDRGQAIPSYMHMMRHVFKSRKRLVAHNFKLLTGVKAFHRVEAITLLHNHIPLACRSGYCRGYFVDAADARLQHYKNHCGQVAVDESCEYLGEERIYDPFIWKFKDELLVRMDGVIADILKRLTKNNPFQSNDSTSVEISGA